MPWEKQFGHASALECLSRRSRLPFAYGDSDLPLPRPVSTAMLVAKASVSGESRLGHRQEPGTLKSQPVSYCHKYDINAA